MIAWRGFLLESSFMLLVDHNESQAAGGREHGAASADDHLHLARDDPAPLSAALGVAQVAVQHGNLAATAVELLNRLRREADLRYENDGLFALAHDLLDGSEVEFRLAAARDTVQEEGVKTTLAHGLLDGGPRLQLIRVQIDDGLRLRRVFQGFREPVYPLHLPASHSLEDQCFDRPGATS